MLRHSKGGERELTETHTKFSTDGANAVPFVGILLKLERIWPRWITSPAVSLEVHRTRDHMIPDVYQACGTILRCVHARTVRTAIVTLSKVNCCICARPASLSLSSDHVEAHIRDEPPVFSHAIKRDPSIFSFDWRLSSPNISNLILCYVNYSLSSLGDVWYKRM